MLASGVRKSVMTFFGSDERLHVIKRSLKTSAFFKHKFIEYNEANRFSHKEDPELTPLIAY